MASDKKIEVRYYSKTGNTAKLADAIGKGPSTRQYKRRKAWTDATKKVRVHAKRRVFNSSRREGRRSVHAQRLQFKACRKAPDGRLEPGPDQMQGRRPDPLGAV